MYILLNFDKINTCQTKITRRKLIWLQKILVFLKSILQNKFIMREKKKTRMQWRTGVIKRLPEENKHVPILVQ